MRCHPNLWDAFISEIISIQKSNFRYQMVVIIHCTLKIIFTVYV